MSATCPQCGTALRAAASGLCPACLLNLGLQSQSKSPAAAGSQASEALAETLAPTSAPASESPLVERRLPEPGERFGSYQIVRTLGKGGMGAVFEADQLETGRRVALKVLKHSLDSQEARKRFLREGRLAASINHPHSVYVFGTEEIDGTPAITMELVAGGTLAELVKREGPLPIGRAVDIVLQIIAGLEAAQKLGVLHRDIKPANCFVGADGNVKVGDFGLSISTGPRGEADVTRTGSFLGTPAFSSPEQLRGDELNVRSDMYSVGVTLYYLLTGKTPFEADNMVKLLATVLEKVPDSPQKLRPEIPRGLANVVLRCLAKQPGDRYADYAALRQALQPFASAAPTAGTLGLRFIAAVFDMFIIWPIAFLFLIMVTSDVHTLANMQQNGGWTATVILLADTLFRLVYFGVFEGLWGASPGKRLCRLKVVGKDRTAPGFIAAFLRAGIVIGLVRMPMVVAYLSGADDGKTAAQIAQLATWGLILAMFSSARRANGYSGWHDLWTGTCVISTAAESRPGIAVQEDLSEADSQGHIGPYSILRPFSVDNHAPANPAEWLLAYDTRLLGRVWIQRLPAEAAEVNKVRRGIARVGRLRWLTGVRSAAENWDAYEAPSGAPLLELLPLQPSWQAVRYWLLDLAEELQQARHDETLPAKLNLNRVWITADGRARLLDAAAPGLTDSESLSDPQVFLQQVARAAVEGQVPETSDHRLPERPLPMQARAALQLLPQSGGLEQFGRLLSESLRQPPEVTRERRLLLLLCCLLPGLFLAGIGYLGSVTLTEWRKQDPEVDKLSADLMTIQATERVTPLPENAATQQAKVQALETSIAFQHGDLIRDRSRWNSPLARTIPFSQRQRAEQIAAKYPSVTEAEFQAAEQQLATFFPGPARGLTGKFQIEFMSWIGPILGLGYSVWLCGFSVLAAILVRRGLLLRAFGIELVTANGTPASRLRLLGRSLLTWLPFFLLPFVPAFILPALQAAGVEANLRPLYFVMFLYTHAWLALALWSAIRPVRGLADAICGTWPVPR